MLQSRQLAVIMFTDIVGYTALMGADEQKAFAMLEKNRAIQKPIIEQFSGRWIKELGDGIMASFNTVSDAVNAAIRIQEACHIANQFQLRIGIHLGEVVFENNDVFGDGVNIASRLQAIAKPGCIYISEAVHNNVSNKKDIHTKFIKEESLKNVKEPVRIYQLLAEGVKIAPRLQIEPRVKPQRKVLFIFVIIIALLIAGYYIKTAFSYQKSNQKANAGELIGKSIAVLPFLNMSADSSQEYFGDGMTESIITDLAQIPGLLVIARNSVFQYKGKSTDPVEVGNQLNVRYILQGRVQHSGDNLRITVQLIETQKGFNVWANKFDSKMKDVFLMQDDISKHIIESLKLAIEKEDSILRPPPTQNLQAYDYYLRGHYLFRLNGGNDRNLIDSAIIMFEKAIALDPGFALAYAALGKAYTAIFFIYDADSKWETKAYVAIEKALSLDPKQADAYVAKGNLTWTLANGFPHEKAVNEYKRAIQLNPNLVEAHEGIGAIYFHIGMLDESLHELRVALTLDPASRFSRPRIARVHWYQQKYDTALAEFSAINQPDWQREKALVQWYLGQTNEAFKTLDQLATLKRTASQEADLAATYAVLLAGVGRKKDADDKIKFAVQHGQGISHFHHAEHLIASAYSLMGDTTSAMEWLQKATDHGFPCYPLFSTDPNLRNLRKDPAFNSLMQRLKIQLAFYTASLK